MPGKQRKPLKKKRAKLTHRQARFLKELPNASSRADAARKAGYTTHRADQAGYQALKQIEGQMNGLLERHDLTDDAVIEKYLVPLMNAKETKFFAHEGKVVSTREVKAWGPRAKGLDTFSMIRGWYKQEAENVATGVTVIINAANRPPRDPSERIIVPPALLGNGIPPNGNGEPT